MTRLPSVTTGLLRRVPAWRVALASAGLVLTLAGVFFPRESPAAATPASLARAIAADAVAVRVPHAWFAAPPPRVVVGDRVDILGARAVDRSAVAVASAARVVLVEPEALVLELGAEDAAALAVARAGGYLLVVLLLPGR